MAGVASLVLLQMRRLNDGGFQIVHFSVQGNHLHLIVEAKRGKVWDDRHYRRDITSAREMHDVLAYVFGNAKNTGSFRAMR